MRFLTQSPAGRFIGSALVGCIWIALATTPGLAAQGPGAACKRALGPRQEVASAFLAADLAELNEAATRSRLQDPAFVELCFQRLRTLLVRYQRAPGYEFMHAEFLATKLSRNSGNHDALVSILKMTLARVMRGSGANDFGMSDLLAGLFSGTALKEELPEVVGQLLDASDRGDKIRFADDFLAKTFARLQPGSEVRERVLEHYLAMLANASRGHLLYFGQLNSIEELKSIPVALGVDGSLERLSQLKRALNYKEWSQIGIVEGESKAISTFDTTFDTVVSRAPAVHFEVGTLLKDTDRLRASLAQIRRVGPRRILDRLGGIYERGKPNVATGDPSITNLELYWVLSNPSFFAKTTFYERFSRISPERVARLRAELGFKE